MARVSWMWGGKKHYGTLIRETKTHKFARTKNGKIKKIVKKKKKKGKKIGGAKGKKSKKGFFSKIFGSK